ncbi:MAG: stage II sporulation protein M [Candidatus Pacearchaeota archaeon]|nr:stage II sporulation protein M [Candidatus Pacearchaeota archaeon]
MLEFLINPKRAERRPWEMIIVGFFYAVIAILLSIFLFYKSQALEGYSSIFIITFTVILSIPFVYYLIKLEEKKENLIIEEESIMKEHGKALKALIFLFLGYIIAFSIAFLIMPQDLTSVTFKAQLETYCSVNPGDVQNCQGNLLSGAATAVSQLTLKEGLGRVSSILTNNFFVLMTTLMLSLLFGAGAIFILAWNASVIATAIGLFSKGSLVNLPGGFLRYLIHGIPEIAAYFVAALAGGIVSIAIIRHGFKTKEFWHVLKDSMNLIVLALIILIVAAFVEVFLTPSIISLLNL